MPDPRNLTVAALQLNAQEDVRQNLSAVRAGVERAASRGARLVLLPENFAYMGPEPGKRALAERWGDAEAPIQAALSELARSTGATLVAGGFPERSDDADRPYNTCGVFRPRGQHDVEAPYRKLHLFDVELPDGSSLRESEATRAGGDLVVSEIGGFRVGLSICYDLRFPELYRGLVDRGAELIVVPAAFTLQTGKDHWHVLLRARAIEAQCWVLAAAQWGQHPRGRQCYGHSLLVDPWGNVVADHSDRVGELVGTIDAESLERIREKLPSLKHRRL
jgi:deaminated glutathione amidase